MKPLSIEEINKKLKDSVWFIRDRNFKYSMTNDSIVSGKIDYHNLENWTILQSFKIETEADILLALQTLKAEVIKFETEKVKRYGDKNCTCYQLQDWAFLNWYDTDNYALKVADNEYAIMAIKFAIILENKENKDDNND